MRDHVAQSIPRRDTLLHGSIVTRRRRVSGPLLLRQQLDHLRDFFGPVVRITVVVGFKMGLVMEAAASDASFVYNEVYDQTNTCKSLLKALRLAPPGGVLWLNGDVVFVPGLLDALRPHLDALPLRIVGERAAEDEVGVRTHHPQRHDDVPRLERPRRRLGQERRVEHEVLAADDHRLAPAEESRDVRAREAAAEDQDIVLFHALG